MICHVPDCLGHYDFDEIALFARKRFIEGIDTVTLMSQAQNDREREQIALVSLLSIENDQVKSIQVSCRYANECQVTTCRQRLKKMIEAELHH